MQRGLLARARARHAAYDLVAFGAAGTRSARDLWCDVARVARALPNAPLGSEVPLVIRTDRYALLVAVLSAWTRGYVPCLPPEHDREAITALATGKSCASVLHDTASGIPLQISGLLGQGSDDDTLSADVAELACATRVYARNLDNALSPQRWGEDWLGQAAALLDLVGLKPGQRCATSVGPGHPHGVVLGVLLPLLGNAAFLREPLPPHALGAQLSALAVDVLVSVPAHVGELLEGTAQTKAKLARLVSALDPLEPELATQVSARLGASVQDLASEARQIPVLRSSDAAPLAAPDEDAEARALLQFLRAQPGVRDAAVVRLLHPAPARLCVGVTGEAFNLAALRAQLALRSEHAELLALRDLRRDAIGRFRPSELLRQFRLRPNGEPIQFELVFGASSARALANGSEHRTDVHIPLDYPYFDGHFPGYPILPGAAQLSELILPCVRRARPELRRLMQMSRLKFSGRIQPGDTISVALTLQPSSPALDFALWRGTTLCSAGSLSFASEAAR
jgi:3-hydroxymyristoyl/3-hydroxydecanoyl-(acyl carrier protein) dehydratase